jgi:hypothetical protein
MLSGAQECPSDVDPEHQVKSLHRRRFGRRQVDRAGVIDEDVDAAKGLGRPSGRSNHLFFLADVAPDRERLAPRGLDFSRRTVNRAGQLGVRFNGFGRDRDVGAIRGRTPDDGEPDAA